VSYQDRLVAAVQDLSRALLGAGDEQDGLRRTVEIAMKAVEATGATIYLHDVESGGLRFTRAIGASPTGAAADALGLIGETLAPGEGIAGTVYETGEALVVNNASADPRHTDRIDEYMGSDTRNMVTIPVDRLDGTKLGVLQVLNRREGDFTNDDVTILRALVQVLALAVAVRRASAAEA
jgi:GAF domain-containing protein